MTEEMQDREDESEDADAWWDSLPPSILEGIRAEAEMWRKIKEREAELQKPWGLLGLLGYRTNTGCW